MASFNQKFIRNWPVAGVFIAYSAIIFIAFGASNAHAQNQANSSEGQPNNGELKAVLVTDKATSSELTSLSDEPLSRLVNGDKTFSCCNGWRTCFASLILCEWLAAFEI